MKLIIFVALIGTTAAFGFGGGGCGCSAPPACAPAAPACAPAVPACGPVASGCGGGGPLGGGVVSGGYGGGGAYATPPIFGPQHQQPQQSFIPQPQQQAPQGGYVQQPQQQFQPQPQQQQFIPQPQAQPQYAPAASQSYQQQAPPPPPPPPPPPSGGNYAQGPVAAAAGGKLTEVEDEPAAAEATTAKADPQQPGDVLEAVDIKQLKLTNDSECNSEELRTVILENIDEDLNSSKRLIQLAAEAKFGGRFDVICATNDFSYVTNTELYCQHTQKDVSCYAYRQL